MSLRRGIVVEVHSGDHSVDLVLSRTGQRLVGVPVMTSNGGNRSGTTNLPPIPKKKNKWDVTEETGQDLIALVDEMDGYPVVIGFLYPQINQILHDDPNLFHARHQSDVTMMIDGDGGVQIDHPSGLFIRIAESTDHSPINGTNTDKNAKIDRNTTKRVTVKLNLADGKGTLLIDPNGNVSLSVAGSVDVVSGGHTNIKCTSALIDTPTTHLTGDLKVDGKITATGDVIGANVSLSKHTHGGVLSGPSTTGAPIPS